MSESVDIVSSPQLIPFSAVQINSKATKKRKADIASLSSITTISDTELSSQNSAYFLQKAVDNLKQASEKEAD